MSNTNNITQTKKQKTTSCDEEHTTHEHDMDTQNKEMNQITCSSHDEISMSKGNTTNTREGKKAISG